MIIGPDEKLREFYVNLSVRQLLEKIALSHKYQQSVMFNCHGRKQPVEKYITALVSSQRHVLTMIEIIIEKVEKEIKENGSQEIN